MKRILPVFPIALMLGIVGCERKQNAPPNAAPSATKTTNVDATTVEGVVAPHTESITVSDLMQSLDMRIFKTRINGPGMQAVGRVVLFVKLPQSEASEVVSIEIDDSATPGTLRVFLQKSPWSEYAYRAGISYEGDNGHSRQASNVIKDDPFRNVVGTRTGSGITNHPGTAIIECSGTFGGSNADVATTPDAAAIFVRLE